MSHPRITDRIEPNARQATLLASLTPAEAEIILAVDFGGQNVEQAAAALRMPITTAQWRYRKAHRRLLSVV